MKVNKLWSGMLATIVIAGLRPSHAEEKESRRPGTGTQAKTDYCKTCHGLSGQGFRGSFPMPRLAGQRPEYVKNQLQAFIERRRTNP